MGQQAQLAGVWAKLDRTVEQLETLDLEIKRLWSDDSHPYAIRHNFHLERGEHRFDIEPRWSPKAALRIGVMIGEIVHDLRSALDNLVWQLVILNGQVSPDRGHSFPLWSKEPSEAFADLSRRPSSDSRQPERRGPLFGVSDEATAIIKACQPYTRPDLVGLARLDALWNMDKHRHLTPLNYAADPPAVVPSHTPVLERVDRIDGSTQVVELTVPPNTEVDVKPSAPVDVTLEEGIPIGVELQATTKVVFWIVDTASRLFPLIEGSPAL